MSSASRGSGTRRRMKLPSRDCSRLTTSEIRRSCSRVISSRLPRPSSTDVDELGGANIVGAGKTEGAKLHFWLEGYHGQFTLEQCVHHRRVPGDKVRADCHAAAARARDAPRRRRADHPLTRNRSCPSSRDSPESWPSCRRLHGPECGSDTQMSRRCWGRENPCAG